MEDKEFREAVEQVKKRIHGTKIEIIEVDEGNSEGLDSNLTLSFAKGTHHERVLLWEGELPQLLQQPFERYHFLSDYQSIVSYEDGVVEATLVTTNVFVQRLLLQISGAKQIGDLQEDGDPARYTFPRPMESAIEVSIGFASPLHGTLVSSLDPFENDSNLTIRLCNLNITNQEEASTLLERVAHSALFQIDLQHSYLLRLARNSPRRGSFRQKSKPRSALPFPSHRYDRDPMALYVYARGALGMPLLQFLAFYQCLEFYFPRYARQEALHALTNVLKDPRFNPHSTTDVERALNVVQRGAGRDFGNEQSQLKATLHHCVSAEDLREFLQKDEKRKGHLEGKSIQGAHRVAFKDVKADLHAEVAHRIYDIRCRIVHAKSSGVNGREEAPLLPFSNEEDALYYDIQVVQFLAQQALIAASTELHLP